MKKIAPPFFASLRANNEFKTIPSPETKKIAPPYEVAMFLVKLEFITVPLPLNTIAPPTISPSLPVALFSVNTQFSTLPRIPAK